MGLFKKRLYLFIFREGGREEGERERVNIDVSEKCQSGTEPKTQACTLTKNGTGNLLLCGMTPK